MGYDRRDFIRGVGVMLASLLTTRCFGRTACYVPAAPTPTPPKPPMPACYEVVPSPTPKPPAGESKDWDRLRNPWHDLDRLASAAPDLERGQKMHERLVAEHRGALDKLVGAGELDPAVADEMQAAFEGAAYHVWRANAPITCYESVELYQVESSSDLARQAEMLAEMAEKSAIDDSTLAQAQSAIERDIAFLAMTAEEQRALVETVLEAAGDSGDFPRLAELDMDIPPEPAQAARILVDLLLGD